MVVADRFFAGSVPEIYDGFLVPLIFDCYASDLAERLAAVKPREVLETAAGPARSREPSHRGFRLRRALCQPISISQCSIVPQQFSPMISGLSGFSRCACLAVRGPKIRRCSLPVRRDVLSRQGPRLQRGASCAQDGWPFPFQCVGPNLGE